MKCNETIGQRIGKLRTDRGWTQSELAKKLSVKRETVAQWEADTREIKASYIIKLADLFKVSADYILCRNDISSSDVDFVNMCEFLNLSEKTIWAIKEETEQIIYDSAAAEKDFEEPLKILEFLLGENPMPIMNIVHIIENLRISKDIKSFVSLKPFNRYAAGYSAQRYAEDRIKIEEFHAQKKLLEICENAVEKLQSLLIDDEWQELKEMETMAEIYKKSKNLSSFLVEFELEEFFAPLLQQAVKEEQEEKKLCDDALDCEF